MGLGAGVLGGLLGSELGAIADQGGDGAVTDENEGVIGLRAARLIPVVQAQGSDFFHDPAAVNGPDHALSGRDGDDLVDRDAFDASRRGAMEVIARPEAGVDGSAWAAA